jgi:two-component system response regulator FixJ
MSDLSHERRDVPKAVPDQLMVESIMAYPRNVIAVIDDNREVREGIKHLLSSAGYRVELFASAEEFINAVENSEAKCLVVDFQLGDITGVELVRHLSAMGFKFPIIFISGAEESVLRSEALDFYYVAYLQKPLLEHQLIEAVTRAIGSK